MTEPTSALKDFHVRPAVSANDEASFVTSRSNEAAVSDQQSKLIENAYSDAIVANKSDSQIRALRLDLAKNLGINVKQVRAVTSWCLIRAKYALEHEQIKSMKSKDLISLARRVELSSSDRMRHAIIQEDSFRLDVGEQQLQRLVTSYHTGGRIGAVRRDRQSTLESLTHAASAAGADYDTLVKQAWRELWFKHLDTHVPRAERKHKTILCLPSAFPEREISGYLALGFKRSNIIAVEGDRRNGPEFARRCRELGVRFFNASLDRVIPDLDRPIDILSLDFAGCFCPAYADILEATPLRSGAIVMINCQEGRERIQIQESLMRYPKMINGLLKEGERLIDLPTVRLLTCAPPEPTVSVEGSVTELDRELGFSSMLIGMLSSKTLSSTTADENNEAEVHMRRVQAHRVFRSLEPAQFTTALVKALFSFTGFDEMNCPKALIDLVRAFRSVCDKLHSGGIAICNAEQIRYRSHATSAHRPFSTFIATLRIAQDELDRAKDIGRFLSEVHEALTRSPKSSREVRFSLHTSPEQERKFSHLRKITPAAEYWVKLATSELRAVVNGRVVSTIDTCNLIRDLRGWIAELGTEVSAVEASRVRVRILGDPTPYLFASLDESF